MISTWLDNSNIPTFNQLNKNIKTDVLIIGGGMAGILCAHMLEQQGVDYILVESQKILQGITKNTTAKITSQHGLIYHKLIKDFGIKNAALYLEANNQAVEKYKQLSNSFDCDFEEKDAYVYSLENKEKIQKELSALNSLNFEPVHKTDIILPFDIAGAIKFRNQAQFNPLKFASKIAKNLKIYETTTVNQINGHTAITDCGTITADKIIVTTHFPFINTHGSYFLKMYQHRSYVIALENAQNINGMYLDEALCGMSFRNYKNLLLIGGGDHRTGKSGGNWNELRQFAKKYYPNATEKYAWATQDCMTLDGVPYIGQYSKHTPNLYVATGFNKWGMTTSMVAGNILSDMVMGKSNKFTQLFSPHRSMLKPQLAVNATQAVMNLATISKKRCPHMGCALKWNPVEHSWDCPCHGSRFSKKGNIIDNPTMKNLKNP